MSSTAEVKSLRRELSALKSQVAKIAQVTVLLPRIKHKLTSVEVGADVTGGHAGDIALSDLSEKNVDSLTDTDNYKRLTEAKDTKVAGMEAGADVTIDHQGDIHLENLASFFLPSVAYHGDVGITPQSDFLSYADQKFTVTQTQGASPSSGSLANLFNLTHSDARWNDVDPVIIIEIDFDAIIHYWRRVGISFNYARPAQNIKWEYYSTEDSQWHDIVDITDNSENVVMSTFDANWVSKIRLTFSGIVNDGEIAIEELYAYTAAYPTQGGIGEIAYKDGVKVVDLEPAETGADVTGSHQGDVNIDNIAEGDAYKKYLAAERSKMTGMEAGADVTENNQAASIADQGDLATLDDVDTPQIVDNAVTILTTAQDDSWWYLDPSPMGLTGFGLYRAAVLTAEFTSTGFPCQIDFDASVDGRNLTFVSKSMHAIFRAVDTYAEFSISTITLSGSNLVEITTTAAHGLSTDDFVWLWGIVGTIELNEAICKVTVVSSTEFTLQLTRSDWFTGYTSGGIVRHVDLWGLRYGFLYHEHDTGIHMSLFDDYLDDGRVYQYIGAIRNRNSSQYAYINEGSVIRALEIKK